MSEIKSGVKTDFYERVYAVVAEIPYGRVTSYGAIAAYLGARSSARMVGWALNALNAHGARPDVPAHRVVNRNGLLSGKAHFGTADAMRALLEAENIRVEDDRVADFERLFWDPLSDAHATDEQNDAVS